MRSTRGTEVMREKFGKNMEKWLDAFKFSLSYLLFHHKNFSFGKWLKEILPLNYFMETFK
jgi:hypothetical protein